MNIAKAEAQETKYWLRLIGESGMLQKSRLGPLVAESEELCKILTAIIMKAERNTNRG